jgi:hypothetical protein
MSTTKKNDIGDVIRRIIMHRIIYKPKGEMWTQESRLETS